MAFNHYAALILMVALSVGTAFTNGAPVVLATSSDGGGEAKLDFCSSNFTRVKGQDFRGTEGMWFGYASSGRMHHIACAGVNYPPLDPYPSRGSEYHVINKFVVLDANPTEALDVSTIGYFGYIPPSEPNAGQLDEYTKSRSGERLLSDWQQQQAQPQTILHEMYQASEIPMFIKTKILDTDYSNYLVLYICAHANGETTENISVMTRRPGEWSGLTTSSNSASEVVPNELKKKRKQLSSAGTSSSTFENLLLHLQMVSPDKVQRLSRINSNACPFVGAA